MADTDTDIRDETQPEDSGEEVTKDLQVDESNDDDNGETADETGDQEDEAANHEPTAEGDNEGEEKAGAGRPEEELDQPTAREDDEGEEKAGAGRPEEELDQPTAREDDEAADENVDEAADDKGDDDSEEHKDVVENENVTNDNTEEGGEHMDEVVTKSPELDEAEGDEEPEEMFEDKQGDSNSTEETFTMPEEDRIKCRRLFDKKAINDRLTLAGLKAVFRLMGQVLTSSGADQIFEEADKDGDDTVDFDEFCRLYSRYGQEEETRKSILLHSVDKLFKCNQDGEVDLSEVEQVLLKLQQPGPNSRLVREKSDLGPDDIRSLVKAMDRDGNGRISKREFVDTLCQHIEG